MRAMGVLRFVVLGTVGFGIGWAVVGAFTLTTPMWPYFFAGACGGAALGVATGDRKRVAASALTGALGFGIGFHVSLFIAGMLYSFMAVGMLTGMVGGAMLGWALGGWRWVAVSALAGLVGFGIGEAVVPILQPLVVDYSVDWARSPPPWWRLASVQAIAGIIGGASLGAAVGYLENRKLAAEQRPRVR